MGTTCDVIVLGMGTSGEDASLRLAGAGIDVVGIEAKLVGGECPYWACIPTKSLVRSANLLAEARRADGLVGRVDVHPDWSVIASRIRSEITGGWDDSAGVGRFEARGGRFVRGWGRVVGPRTVDVDGEVLKARRGILVATGSEPRIPPIPGLDEVPYWTNHEAVATEELPESLVVLGGGAVGCELGQVFARFGVDVTLVEGADRVLPGEEPEASRVVAEALAGDGIELRLGVRADAVRPRDSRSSLLLSDGDEITAERVLVATGRRGDAEALGLASAGAAIEDGFVSVDGTMRAAEGLWAIGDVTGEALLTQVAEYQGTIAVEDILGAAPRPADYSVLPRAVFTDPEVGAVGMTEAVARSEGREVEVVTKDLSATFRGWLHAGDNSGVIKLVVDGGRERLLGATVVGPNASEVLGFLALAVQQRTRLADLVNTIYAFPTFYGGIGEALGAYGRGITRVLDPGSTPLFDDPPPAI